MRFIDHNIRTIRDSFEFSGRSRRAEVVDYWVFYLLVAIAWVTVSRGFLPTSLAVPGDMLFDIAVCIPMPAQFVRRLNDWNAPRYLVIVLFFFLILAFVAPSPFGVLSSSSIPRDTWLVVMAPLSLILLVLEFWRGTDGPNSHGADPRPEWYDDNLQGIEQ